MDLASTVFISTYKSWHCVTSIKITLKNTAIKIQLQKSKQATHTSSTSRYSPVSIQLFTVYCCVVFLQDFQHLWATELCRNLFTFGKRIA